MKKLNLIIPMAGQGKRFRKAGYTTFKPFVPIKGKPMIQHVTDLFPASVRKFVITARSLLTAEQARFLEHDLRSEILDIPPHEEGPAFSIRQAQSQLPLDESFFIAYCDIFWRWDFAPIRRRLEEDDGAIFTHSGFHPHLVGRNFSAFCRPEQNDPTLLAEIREKGSFTEDWMREPLSVGLFYVRSGEAMMVAIDRLIRNNIRVANEFFPSLLFNDLAKQNKKIRLQPLDFYIHWGVPDQLQDFERWDAIFTHEKNFKPAAGPQYPENLMMMAGLGNRMRRVAEEPKALIPIDGKPMFKFMAERFPSRAATLITTPEIAKTLDGYETKNKLFLLERQTGSQFETLLSSVELLKNARDFFLTSCDAYGLFDFPRFRNFTKAKNPDAVIFTFKPSLLQQKMAGHHTHVSVEKDRVTAVHIKSKSKPDDLGFAGFFWVNRGTIFDSIRDVALSQTNEMCADHVFKHFVEKGLNVARFDLDQYIHLGTAEELLEHRYWAERKFLFA